jgi:hypothetical protein
MRRIRIFRKRPGFSVPNHHRILCRLRRIVRQRTVWRPLAKTVRLSVGISRIPAPIKHPKFVAAHQKLPAVAAFLARGLLNLQLASEFFGGGKMTAAWL